MRYTRILILLGVLVLSFALVGGALAAANAGQQNVDPVMAASGGIQSLNFSQGRGLLKPLPSSPARMAPPPTLIWEKKLRINGGPWIFWTPQITITVETSDVIEVMEVIHFQQEPYKFKEVWGGPDMPPRLQLIDSSIYPPTPPIPTDPWEMEYELDNGVTYTITKWFHVEPCYWPYVVLHEWLETIDPTAGKPNLIDQKDVLIYKKPPVLWIDNINFTPQVFPGEVGNFMLLYGNEGGFENKAKIVNVFPPEAPFLVSNPPADFVSPDRLTAEWYFPMGIPGGNFSDTIDVVVAISKTVQPSMTIVITDFIFDHIQEMVDLTVIRFHVNDQPPPPWRKWVNGLPWTPYFTVTAETSDTIEIVDVIASPEFTGAEFQEKWIPEHLDLLDWEVRTKKPEVGWNVITDTGKFVLLLPESSDLVTLTKWFHVEPCTWTETIIWERFFFEKQEIVRPVVVFKEPYDLWIDADPLYQEVFAGDTADFVLRYGNNGGREVDTWIRNDFPQEALFVSSVPPPDYQAFDGTSAVWMTGELGKDDEGAISVTVAVSSTLEPSTTIVITDIIYDHLELPADIVTVTLHVTEPYEQEEYDIYLKDNLADDGSVPSSGDWWNSPDIWVRTDGDCTNLTHQNPTPGATNTVCVRVRNRMTTTVEDIEVDVYYAVAALGITWPWGWTYIDTIHIASLAGGAETVEALSWPTPAIEGHFCLLARADAPPKDQIGSGPDTVAPTDHVPNNNNIAQKNANIVDYPEVKDCGFYSTTVYTEVVYFDAVNTKDSAISIDIKLTSDDFPMDGVLILEPGALWGSWSALSNFDQDGATLLPTAFPAMMEGMPMDPHATVRMTLTLAAEVDESFTVSIEEWTGDTLIGGIDYVRQMPICLYLPLLMNDYTPTATLYTTISYGNRHVAWLSRALIQ